MLGISQHHNKDNIQNQPFSCLLFVLGRQYLTSPPSPVAAQGRRNTDEARGRRPAWSYHLRLEATK